MKRITIGAVLFAVLVLSSCDMNVVFAPLESGLSVSRVIYGDTLEMSNGEIVRLIGISAPGAAAAEFARNKVEGRTVLLEAYGTNRDSYGRLRRHVWVQRPQNQEEWYCISTYKLNTLLISYGHARVFIDGPIRADVREVFESAEWRFDHGFPPLRRQ